MICGDRGSSSDELLARFPIEFRPRTSRWRAHSLFPTSAFALIICLEYPGSAGRQVQIEDWI
jgi:hypothetical protein